MELAEYLYVLRKFWVSLVAVTLLGIAAGAAYVLLATPLYTSATSMFFTVQTAGTIGEAATGSSFAERQVTSFAEVAKTPIVLQPVIDELGLETTPGGLAQQLVVSIPRSTSIIDLKVTDERPELAAAIATGITESLIRTVDQIAPRDRLTTRPLVEAHVIKPAMVPTGWSSPSVFRSLLLGLLLGVLAGFGLALLRHLLDRKVRNSEDVAAVTDIAVVGTIGIDDVAGAHPLAIVNDPQSARAEDYRRLRTNLRFLAVGTAVPGVNKKAQVLAVSSSVAGEGKTTTTMNLALALAAAGMKVLLVDADLRRPMVAKLLKLEGAVGLTTVLIGGARLLEVVQPVIEGLDVLPSGRIPPNPSEMLGSAAMHELLERASANYDYILVDTAPLVSVADTAGLASAVDGVVIVAGSGMVDRDQLAAAIRVVQAAEGHVAGIVLNKLKGADVSYRSHYYTRRYGYGPTQYPEPLTPPMPATAPATPAPAGPSAGPWEPVDAGARKDGTRRRALQ